MDISPEDLRIDVARMVGDGPCAVRVTYTPTRTTVQVDDQPSTEANHDLALARLREKLSAS